MLRERSRAVDVGADSGGKRIKKWLVALILIFIIAIGSGYLVSRTPIEPQITSPSTYETFKTDLQPMKTSLNIVGLGDSLTAGVGDPDEKGYAGLTVQSLKKSDSTSDVHFVDYGIKGDTTADLLTVLNKNNVQESIRNADIVFMTIGGNDLVGVLKENFLDLNIDDFNAPRLTFQKNFNDIIQKIQELNPKATVYYLGLYNPFEDLFPDLDPQFESILQKWNQSSETILELYPHAVFVPTADLFKDKSEQLLYNDHFHPNKKGYELMSQRLLSFIQRGEGETTQLTKR